MTLDIYHGFGCIHTLYVCSIFTMGLDAYIHCMYVRIVTYVCMFGCFELLCMYACLEVSNCYACMYVCMYVCLEVSNCYVCMYVCKSCEHTMYVWVYPYILCVFTFFPCMDVCMDGCMYGWMFHNKYESKKGRPAY